MFRLLDNTKERLKFWGSNPNSDDDTQNESKQDSHPAINIHKGRNYTILEDPKADKFVFYVMGCAGNASEQQQNVAKKMNEVASHDEAKPAFGIVLGDNFYHY